MTRRLTIVLDDSVIESSCGSCRWSFRPPSAGTRTPRTHCRVFGLLDGSRSPECIEAERAAARMVEIDPKDARAILDIDTHPADAVNGANRRIVEAFREHARKAAR